MLMKYLLLLLCVTIVATACQNEHRRAPVEYSQPATTPANEQQPTATDEATAEERIQQAAGDAAQSIAQHHVKKNVTAEYTLPLNKVAPDEYIVDGTYIVHDGTSRTMGFSTTMKLKKGGNPYDMYDWLCYTFYAGGRKLKDVPGY